MNINKLIFALLFAFSSPTLVAQILINEFLASNSSTITDTLFNETADWIELYNNSNTDFNLSGYYLTDNLNKPDKWQFPHSSIIKANSFLLIWADGEDTGLHTSFKISADGEELGLFNPDLQMIDTCSFGSQESDVSYGRFEDASDTWFYFQIPSPAYSNNNSFLTLESPIMFPFFLSMVVFIPQSKIWRSQALEGKYTILQMAPLLLLMMIFLLRKLVLMKILLSEPELLKYRKFRVQLLLNPTSLKVHLKTGNYR